MVIYGRLIFHEQKCVWLQLRYHMLERLSIRDGGPEDLLWVVVVKAPVVDPPAGGDLTCSIVVAVN